MLGDSVGLFSAEPLGQGRPGELTSGGTGNSEEEELPEVPSSTLASYRIPWKDF